MKRLKAGITKWFQKRVEGIIPTGKYKYWKLVKLYFYIACLTILIRAMFFYE